MIISFGYRVKSILGTQFRIWANKLIKEYLIKGYNINVRRFKNNGWGVCFEELLKHGELFYMLVSSFCFAIVHGVSLGIPQIVYTFILGMIWSYLVVKTGSIKLSIILHSLSNLFGSIIIQLLQGISMEILGMYSMFMMLLGIIGFICFLKNKKKVELDNKNKLFDKTIIKEMFTNKGILVYSLITMTMIVLKNVL